MARPADVAERPTALVLLASGMILFGTGTPVSKIVTAHLPAMLASSLRVAMAALVLLPFVIRRRSLFLELGRADYLRIAGIALLGVFGFTLAMFHGMTMVSGVVGSVVMSTTPAVTALGARFFLGEQLGWRRGAAVALAVAGVLVLQLGANTEGTEGGGNEVLVGAALVFCAVCGEASYTLLGKRMSEKADPLFIGGVASLAAVALFLPFGLHDLAGSSLGTVPWQGWLAVGFWGACTFGLGTMLWYGGLARSSGATAAGFMGLMPLSALILSYVLLSEPFHWAHLAGFAIVLAGVGLIAWDHARATRDDTAAQPRRADRPLIPSRQSS